MTEKYDWNMLQAEMDSKTCRTTMPILSGRITPKRAQVIKQYWSNRDITAPYGVSPNGYAYRCGCEHDCCGCLVGAYYKVVFQQSDFGSEEYDVFLEYRERYNY